MIKKKIAGKKGIVKKKSGVVPIDDRKKMLARLMEILRSFDGGKTLARNAGGGVFGGVLTMLM